MKYDGYGRLGGSGARVVAGGTRRSPGRDGRGERRTPEPVTQRRTDGTTR